MPVSMTLRMFGQRNVVLKPMPTIITMEVILFDIQGGPFKWEHLNLCYLWFQEKTLRYKSCTV